MIVSKHLRFGVPLWLSLLVPHLGAVPPAPPSNLVFSASESITSASLEWDDNSDDELGFELQYRLDGETEWARSRLLGPDITQQSFGSGFVAGEPIYFRVRAGNGDLPDAEWSEFSNEVQVTTLNFHIDSSCITVTPGDDFAYPITASFPLLLPAPASPLPDWIHWDPETGILSGSNAEAGVYPIDLEVSWGIHSRERTFYVQVINGPPVVVDTLPDLEIIARPPASTVPIQVDLTTVFDEPDIGRAAVIETSAGPIPVGFYAGAPLTVDNFFAYANSDAWDGSFFHRNATNFVIQGGGYKPDGTGDFMTIPDLDPVTNEFDPSRSNICGTIAMAKIGGMPDSATNEFFFNLDDNSDGPNGLDTQNGGFTVFGRATDMSTINKISSYRIDTYSIALDGVSRSFKDWPLSSYGPTSPLPSELASILDVREISPLSWTATSSDESVITTAGDGSGIADALTITPAGGSGEAEITVTATDLDGASVSTSFVATVRSTYEAWGATGGVPAAAEPTDRPGGGVLSYLQSYAFGGDPLDPADDRPLLPVPTTVDIDGTTYDALVIRHREFASDLSYGAQVSGDLKAWSTIWSTADGYGAANVVSAVPDGQFTVLTVRRDTPAAGTGALYFRGAVTLQTEG